MSAIIEVPAEILETTANLEIEVAKLKVEDAQSYQAVMDIRKNAKETRRMAEAGFDSLLSPLNLTRNRILTLKKDTLARIDKIIITADTNTRAWATEQESKRREAERAAQEAARRAIEEERLAEAIEMEKTDPGAAQALLEAPIVVSATVESTVPEIAGMSERETWSAEVTDLKALLWHIVVGGGFVTHFGEFEHISPDFAHPELLECVEPVMARLNDLARAQKSMLALPGVKAVSKVSYVQR